MNAGAITEVRMRHKLHGRRVLSDIELLQVVLNYRGNRKYELSDLQKIMKRYEGRLDEFSRTEPQELILESELGESQALMLDAVWELANRKWSCKSNKVPIRSSRDARHLFSHLLVDLNHEEFYVAFLNRANMVVEIPCISRGGVSSTVVDVRLLVKKAIMLQASNVIVAHNHPSGNLQPSDEDRKLTEQIIKGLAYFDIHLIDHLIYAGNQVLSFSDEGWI
jgi:DNA repair protein RadC